jgi:prepilin-type N-terminal cleavage/methylation domain-containing protein
VPVVRRQNAKSLPINVFQFGTRFPLPIGMQTSPFSPRSVAGFSLIELMVTLVIFGIMAGIAAPSMGAYVERQKTRRALDTIATDLAHARVLAIRQGSRVAVSRHGTDHYSVGLVGSAAATRKQVRLGQSFGGVVLTMPSDSIVFDSRGLVRMGQGAISVSINGKTDELDLSITGRVYRAY